MALYRVRAKDMAGKSRTLVRESADESTLAQALSREGLFPLEIRIEAGMKENGRTGAFSLKRKAVEEFTATLSLMLESGLSLKDALEVGRRTAGKGAVRELCSYCIQRIAKGESFSRAIDSLRGFPPVYRGLVKVGERTGSLDEVVRELSGYLEEERKIREKVGNALAYPLLVLVSAFTGIIVLSLVLLPRITGMFSGLGGAGLERVEEISQAMNAVSVALASAAVVTATTGAALFVASRRAAAVKLGIHRVMLFLPVLGAFLMRKEMLSFCFAMQALTASGVGVEDALEEAARVVRNRAIREELFSLRRTLLHGSRFSAALSESSLLPSQFKVWVGIGEETGQVERVFAQLTTFYRKELESFSSRLMVLVEPAVILIVGIIIMTLVVSFVVPLFSLFGSVLE